MEKLYEQYLFALENGDPFHDFRLPLFSNEEEESSDIQKDVTIFDFDN